MQSQIPKRSVHSASRRDEGDEASRFGAWQVCGNSHGTEAFGALVVGDEDKVYGNKAYGWQKNRDFLDRIGVGDRLMYMRP